MTDAFLVLSTASKREAFHLAQAIEGLVYYPDRTVVAGLVALVGAFHGLVEAEDDPAMRSYVHPGHETVQ